MAPGNADRNLLLGILAYQNAFITKEQLLAGMQAWLYDKARPLADILRDQGALDAPCRVLLDALVDQHVQQHGSDPQRSLQAVSSAGSVRKELERLPDPDLQASIVHLLRAKTDEDPYATAAPPSVGQPTSGGLRFRILRPHAKGGLGEVFVAEDEELHREVALKEIQDKHADHPESRSRFLLEAEITGGLEHPGIVPVYGLGQYADGRPFYAMRFIRGNSLQEAIKRFHDLTSRDRQGAGPREPLPDGRGSFDVVEFRKLLGRFIDVCQAIQYAHDRGVLHRDLKPGNIMLGKYGETLVVDWGLAKTRGEPGASATGVSDEPALRPSSASGSAETIAGSAIGTPQYMSPEQAAGRLDLLGPASDVYSLGATLYCLLTGKSPAEDKDVATVLKKVQKGDFPRPREIKRDVDPALEAICLKAMALKPGERYAMPLLLANDIEHWLADEPVSAYREPLTVRAGRWVRRHKALVSAAGAILLVAVPLLASLLALNEEARNNLENEQTKTKKALELAVTNEGIAEKRRIEADDARKQADQRREQAETLALRVEFEHYFSKAEDRPDLALVGMATLLPKATRLKDQSLANSLRLHVGASSGRIARLNTICEHQDHVSAVALSADGGTALMGSRDKTARLWETATGKAIGPPLQHQDGVVAVALSADGKTALTGCWDSTARLWETATGKAIGPPLQHEGDVVAVALSVDGKKAVTGSWDNTARLWDTATGKAIGLLQHEGHVVAVALSADGKTALTGSWDRTARLWETAMGKAIGPPLQHEENVVAVALSVDGRTALTGSWDGTARLWDTATGKPIGPPLEHQHSVLAVALSADGKTALTGVNNNTARLWKIATGKPIGPPLQHRNRVYVVALSADGKTALTGSWDKTARLWTTATGRPIGPPLQHQGSVVAVALSADGKTALTGSVDKTARLWQTATDKEIGPPLQPEGNGVAVALSADGKTALTRMADSNSARLWETATGKPIGPRLQHQDWIFAMALSADGKTALTASRDKTARLWETEAGKPIGPPLHHQAEVSAAALSADGKTVLTGSSDKTARLWEAATGKLMGPPLQHEGTVSAVALSADGKTALTGSEDKTARLWETATGKPIGPPLQHEKNVSYVALSADGKTALTKSEGSMAQLWATATGKPIGPPLQHRAELYGVALSADGNSVLTGGSDKTARLWETASGNPIGPPLQHQDAVVHVALSADGRTALTVSNDRTAYLWETKTGKPIVPPLQVQQMTGSGVEFASGIALSADGKTALTGAQIWKVPQPIRGNPARIMLWAQVITGLEVDELTAVRVLDAATWQQRRQRLQELGGPPVID